MTTEIFMEPEQFKLIREKVGSQWRMANLLKISQTMICNYEKGYVPIPRDVAIKMDNYKTQK